MVVKLVHVGLGGWGTDWERNAFGPVADIERVAWVDAHEPTLELAQQRLQLPADRCFTSIADAFAAVEADALLVTAPQHAHVPLAIEAMEAGKHVLVEKPFAVSVDEAREGVAVAEKTGRILMVSQQYRHYPAVRKAAALVADQAYGPVGTVHVDFRQYANGAPRESNKHYGIDHPLLFDMTIHHFDLMRLILGREPVRVFTQVNDPPWSKFREEASAVLTIEFAGGQVVSYRGSWVSTGAPTFWAGEWNIETEGANIAFTSRQGGDAGTSGDAVEVTPLGGSARSIDLGSPRLWGRSAGLAAFAEAIRHGAEPETSGRNNLGTIALMEAAVRSAASGAVEDVEQIR